MEVFLIGIQLVVSVCTHSLMNLISYLLVTTIMMAACMLQLVLTVLSEAMMNKLDKKFSNLKEERELQVTLTECSVSSSMLTTPI
jgi:hypothetical protein